MDAASKTHEIPWQQSTAALLSAAAMFLVVHAYGLAMLWPVAVNGDTKAVEMLLFLFVTAALAIAMLSAGWGRPKILWFGASAWALTLYVASGRMGVMVTGHNVSVAMRAAGMSCAMFIAAAAWLHKSKNAR